MQLRIIGLSLLALLLLGCGTSREPIADPENPAASTTDTTSTSTTSTPAEWSGPPKLVTVHLDDLVAVDLVDRSRMWVLADRGALARSLGVIVGYIDGVDLSPDGTTVAFTFNGRSEDRSVSALFEVPADGSDEPRRIEVPGADFFLPEYSPDGRLLAVYTGTELVVIPTSGGAPASPGIPMPYPPADLTWSPDGARLIWVPHYERTSCCTLAAAQIEPSTGEILSEVTEEAAEGRPYFDASGALRTQQDWSHWALDLDSSNRYALSVAADGSWSGSVLEWWDTTDPVANPRPLELDFELSEASPVAW